jgi:hypothetical protein
MRCIDNSEICQRIFSEIIRKTGEMHLSLSLTPNNKVRLSIGTRHHFKDFVSPRDALQWLIYSYNLKHLRHILGEYHPTPSYREPLPQKKDVITESVNNLLETLGEFEYFSSELFRKFYTDFETMKSEKNLSNEEFDRIYLMVIEGLKKLLDQTLVPRRYDVYKKYLDHFRIKGYRK